nr:protein O-linked-mannose beta-1,2-N-acetylglucosaminyltransferase 1-like [Penaeus vannamei]
MISPRLSCGRSFVLITGILYALATPTLPATNGDKETWAYLARYDSGLRPMRASAVSAQQTSDDGALDLTVLLNITNFEVTLNGQVVYGPDEKGYKLPYSGLHVIVLHPCEARVMRAQRFLTFQPAEHVDLAELITSIQPGRVVVVVAVPKWFMFFGEEGENALKKLGFTFPSRVASGEPWLGIAVTGHRVIAEALATGRLGQHPPGALDFAVRVPKVCREGRRCDWYEEEKMQTQAKFCELYEGYGDLCSCHDPFTADVRSKQAKLSERKEHIPVVVVTANKPRHLFR